jgi:predicted ATP-grasp superfamily ATP-dependent carboligase
VEPSHELHEILQASPAASGAVVPVLVLKVGRYPLHHGAVGIIRSLGRMGVPVYGIVEDRFTPAAVSRYLTGAFIWDTRDLDARRFLEGMATIGERLNRPTIVIPTDDMAAILIAEQAEALQQWFILPQQPAMLPRTLANKRELYLLCKRMGAACPDSVFPSSIEDVREFVEHASFPVVVKAAESWLLQEGERTTSIAWTAEQACAIYRTTEQQKAVHLIFQEYIPPAYGEDWFYHGYRNVRSDCCIGFTGRKLRSYPPFAGPTTLGKAVVNDPLRQQVEALLQAISYSGIMDLDYRFDKRDGQYKLVDFNPRIGAQFRLFEDSTGVDVARALYLDLTKRRIPRSGPITGRTFIAEFHDIAASIGYFRQGGLTVREWRQSLVGAREFAWFSWDDPLPVLMMCFRLLARVLERVLRMTSTPDIASRMPHYQSGWRNRISQSTESGGTETASGTLSKVTRLARVAVTEPSEAWARIQDRFDERRDRRRPRCPYEVERDWDRRLHQMFGIPWPCETTSEFWALWPEVMRPFEARRERIGRGAFGGGGDGEPGFVRAVWHLVRHLRPANVVETGVARGFTTRFILEALERNGSGHLWSIDAPPVLKPELLGQVGAAVLDRLHHRWSYVRGSSAHRLPGLLSQLGNIDLFIHDSRHTERNVRFELNRAWTALRPGGALLVDDIDLNWGFNSFTRVFSGHQFLICHAEPLQPDPPRFDGKGLFGIIRKKVAVKNSETACDYDASTMEVRDQLARRA